MKVAMDEFEKLKSALDGLIAELLLSGKKGNEIQIASDYWKIWLRQGHDKIPQVVPTTYKGYRIRKI